MNSETRGGEVPASSNLENDSVQEPKRILSRRRFLKGAILGTAGLAVSKFVPESKASEKELEKETKDVREAVELRGEQLPQNIQKAISENNHKHQEHQLELADVIYVLNQRQYIEISNITSSVEKNILFHDLMYFKDEREKKVVVVGDSFMMRNLHEQSKQDGCSELIQILLNAAMIHEATHFHGGDEEVAYTVQIKYLEDQLQMVRAQGATGRYTTQFFVYLSNYIKPYKEHLEKIKKGEIPKDFQKLTA